MLLSRHGSFEMRNLLQVALALSVALASHAAVSADETYVPVDTVAASGRQLDVSGGFLYVLGNTGISKWSLDLTPAGGWPASGFGLSAVGSYVCVAGWRNLTWYSTEGLVLGHASNAQDIVAVDVDGLAITHPVVSESLLVGFSPDGTTMGQWFPYDFYEDDHFIELARVPGGPVYAVRYFDGDASTRVLRLDLSGSGGYDGGFTTLGRCSGPGNNRASVGGIGVDPQGNVYAVDACDFAIEKHGPTGSLLARWVVFGAVDVAADENGNVYVLTSTRIIKYAPAATTGVRASWGQVRARYR